MKLSDIKYKIDILMLTIADLVDSGFVVRKTTWKKNNDIAYDIEINEVHYFLELEKDYFTFNLFNMHHTMIGKNLSTCKQILDIIYNLVMKSQTTVVVGGSPRNTPNAEVSSENPSQDSQNNTDDLWFWADPKPMGWGYLTENKKNNLKTMYKLMKAKYLIY